MKTGKRILFCSTLLTLLLLPSMSFSAGGGPNTFGYLWDDTLVTYNWINTTGGTTVSLSDDSYSSSLPIGFTFEFYGVAKTNFYISSNGFISFDSGSSDLSNDCPLGTSTPNNLIALYWDDMNPGNGGIVRYETFGAAPNRYLVVEFNNVPHYSSGGNLTAQAILYEGSNDIVLQYQDPSSESGSGASTGIENSSGNDPLTVGCDTTYLSGSYAVWIGREGLFMTHDQDGEGYEGTDVSYIITLANRTGLDGTINIAISGNTWTTTCPTSIDIPDDGVDTIQCDVSIPAGSSIGDFDAVLVEATIGSYAASSTLTTTCTDDWLVLAAEPSPNAGMDHAVVSDGAALYRIGGYENQDTIDMYTETDGSWISLASSTHTMDYSVTAAYYDGDIYVFAGAIDGSFAMPDKMLFQAYNITGDSWTDLGDVPGDGTWGGRLVELDGYIYKLGGDSANGFWGNDTVNRYDPVADTWTAMTSMNTARSFFCAFPFNGKIYVTGGASGGQGTDTGEIYDPGTDTWTDDNKTLPIGRMGMACGQAGANGKYIWVAGGGPYSYDSFAYRRDLSINSNWVDFGTLVFNVGRTAGGAIGMNAYVVGGQETAFDPIDVLQYKPIPTTGYTTDDDDDDDDAADDDDDVTDD